MQIPNDGKLLTAFVERHNLKEGELIEWEAIAIRSVSIASLTIDIEYSKLSDDELADPAIGLLLNLLNRNSELVEASVVAFVTGSGAASEVISRASVETSATITYILSGNATHRLLAYFDHYFRGVDRQVKNWRKEIASLSGADAKIHEMATTRRQQANDALRDFINQVLGTQHLEQWPSSIDRRFGEIGDSLSYRTFYARMSSETHGDAEETLRYFVGRLQDPKVFEAMALETIWNSRLYLYYAAASFLRASASYCDRYRLVEATEHIQRLTTEVQEELHRIAKHIGSGIE